MCAIERQAFNLNVQRRKGKNCSSKAANLLDADEHVHGDEGNLHYTRIIELKAIDILIYAVNKYAKLGVEVNEAVGSFRLMKIGFCCHITLRRLVGDGVLSPELRKHKPEHISICSHELS